MVEVNGRPVRVPYDTPAFSIQQSRSGNNVVSNTTSRARPRPDQHITVTYHHTHEKALVFKALLYPFVVGPWFLYRNVQNYSQGYIELFAAQGAWMKSTSIAVTAL